tara:strand:- start:447 stop:1418 length:972 start_codon:yes stop_codon:yes gene_type:complete
VNTNVDNEKWYMHAWRNRTQSAILLLLMFGYAGFLGYLLWGDVGFLLTVIVCIFALTVSPNLPPTLLMNMYKAINIAPKQAPGLHHRLEILSRRAGLPKKPELYYLPSSALNAFAVGSKDHSAIAISDGLLATLDSNELTAVLAHEISHIRSEDTWVMGVADLFSRITSLLSLVGQLLVLINIPLIIYTNLSINWIAIVLLIIAPSISALTQLALSRTREFDADLNAARLTGNPESLARALAKIENRHSGWFEHIFLPGRRTPEPSILRTHPATEERVRRLLSLKPKDMPQKYRTLPPLSSDYTFLNPRVNSRPRWHVNGLWY